MRTLIRVMRILIFWTYEFLTLLVTFLAVYTGFRGLWRMSAMFWIDAILMRIEMSRIKAWAEKF